METEPKRSFEIPNGKLILIGGAENKSPVKKRSDTNKKVLAAFVELCGKSPSIEVITTASNEDVDETYRVYKACFEELGAKNVGHIHHDNRPPAEADLNERITKANGVFFSGGDQLKLTAVYGGTELLSLMKERYVYKGLVVGGTSAGAMAMSTPMIFDGSGTDEIVAAGVKVTTGFEFLRDVCVDTHFVHRGRFVRMAQVIATNPSSSGIGIEEDTAIVITAGIKARVIGSGVVIILDGATSHGTNITSFDDDKKITIRDLKVSILSMGEEFTIPCRNLPHL
ncbi:cyanophycinase [Pedobacter endophyticus]|uniref:Cyanophycinase n=1 Tax=Pedobacter endophyticus TaxID=2789740 RepID=A0A7S9L139_9SPHI|nr:cyanophycinase [Pedobacter endophyticus]QPH40483.1 cyanophycinase [Pedobacter endophyticus]